MNKLWSNQPVQHLFFFFISPNSLLIIQQLAIAAMLFIIGLGLAKEHYQPAHVLAYASSNHYHPPEEKSSLPEAKAFPDEKSYEEQITDILQEQKDRLNVILKSDLATEKKLLNIGIETKQSEARISPLVVRSVPNPHNMVALTFDDGPFPRWTEYYVKVLDLHGIPATFFVTGQKVEAYPDGIQIILSAGHEIGNHSYSHQRFTNLQEKDVSRELSSTYKILKYLSGKAPTLFRPPFGSFNQHIVDLAWEQGMRTVTWSVDPKDWRNPGVEALVKTVVRKAKAGDIILLHEGKAETLIALPMIITGIQEKGLEFVSVSTLLGKSI